jgi:hypothetical protein
MNYPTIVTIVEDDPIITFFTGAAEHGVNLHAAGEALIPRHEHIHCKAMPAGSGTTLAQRRNAKMARSAHAYVRGSLRMARHQNRVVSAPRAVDTDLRHLSSRQSRSRRQRQSRELIREVLEIREDLYQFRHVACFLKTSHFTLCLIRFR